MFGLWRRFLRYANEYRLEYHLAQNRALKARWREEHGDEPFPLTPEERELLRKRRDGLSPDDRAEIWSDDDDRLFGLEPRTPDAESER